MTATIERIGTLKMISGRTLQIEPAGAARKLKRKDILRVSHLPDIDLPDMPLRAGQLTVQYGGSGEGYVTVIEDIQRQIPTVLAASSCDCPDTVYRVTR